MIRVILPCKYVVTNKSSNNHIAKTTTRQRRLLVTQNKLRSNVFDKIDKLKTQSNDDTMSTEQLWMDIEQLLKLLTTIRSQINVIEENRKDTNLQRNMQMFQDTRNNNDESMDL